MAAHETRAFIALAGDYYLRPLPQTQLGKGELEAALERVWSGEQALTDVKWDSVRSHTESVTTRDQKD